MVAELDYMGLLFDIQNHGHTKKVFNSDLTISSQLGATIRHNFETDGFPIYKLKFVWWRGAIGEMLWFLTGGSNIRYLRKMGVHIWNDWAWRYWQEVQSKPDHMWRYQGISREKYFELIDAEELFTSVPLHYPNVTNWNRTGLNQTEWVLENLPKKPFRKSYVVNSWDPTTVYQMAEQSGKESVALPACHFAHQLVCNSENMLSMVVYIRSNDLFLGNPFNLVQYGALLQMYCHCLSNRTGVPWRPHELVLQIGDAHIYSNHATAIAELFDRWHSDESDALFDPVNSKPELLIENRGQTNLQEFVIADFKLQNYSNLGKLKAELHVAGGY